ncbi:MAG TPA: alpha/beta fold hydrolase [Herpetosiphonaceae bacterium]
MERRETYWRSSDLGIDMPLVAYGHAGVPLLMFPTAAADYLEYERFYLIHAIAPLIEGGKIRAYAINSVNRYSLLNDHAPAQLKARLLTAFDQYIVNDVIPWIRQDCGDETARPWVTGASLGAFLCLNTTLKHPDLISACVAMSGSYDVRDYLFNYYDDDVYFNNPVDYLPRLEDEFFLSRLRSAVDFVLVSGQGSYENPGRSVQMSHIMAAKGIPCTLDLWGHDVNHDWPWWRKMLPHHLEQLLARSETRGAGPGEAQTIALADPTERGRDQERPAERGQQSAENVSATGDSDNVSIPAPS